LQSAGISRKTFKKTKSYTLHVWRNRETAGVDRKRKQRRRRLTTECF